LITVLLDIRAILRIPVESATDSGVISAG